MAWCRHATSYSEPMLIISYGVTSLQWVNFHQCTKWTNRKLLPVMSCTGGGGGGIFWDVDMYRSFWIPFTTCTSNNGAQVKCLAHLSPLPHIRQCIGSAFVQIMACHLTCSAPSHYPNQCWVIVNWPLGTNFSEILIKIQKFRSWKCIWKYCLRNGGHVVQGEMSEVIVATEILQCGMNMLSFWRNFLVVLEVVQLLVQPVMEISSKWHLFGQLPVQRITKILSKWHFRLIVPRQLSHSLHN